MMKVNQLVAFALMAVLPMAAFAKSDKEKLPSEAYIPEVGSFAVGLSFNPVAAAQGASAASFSSIGQFLYGSEDPDATDGVINNAESKPDQMFIMAQQPMVSISFKYQASKVVAFKAGIGFSGGYVKYREYVQDDKALALDPLSEAQVTDVIGMNYTGGGISLGAEFSAGKRLRFVGGVGLLYSFGGGNTTFDYGNAITSVNQHPTTMTKIDKNINEFKDTSCDWADYGRPVAQNNIGISHGIGIYANLGIEWFFIPHASLGATVDITPIMVAFQPQTYTVYEAYDKYQGVVREYNDLVSPGSTYLLYGTDNIGVSLSLHYYF